MPEPAYGDERLPLGNAQQIAVEDSVKEVTTEKGKAEVQWGVDWGKDLLFLDAEGKGARISIPLEVAEGGRYEIVARTAEAPDYEDQRGRERAHRADQRVRPHRSGGPPRNSSRGQGSPSLAGNGDHWSSANGNAAAGLQTRPGWRTNGHRNRDGQRTYFRAFQTSPIGF